MYVCSLYLLARGEAGATTDDARVDDTGEVIKHILKERVGEGSIWPIQLRPPLIEPQETPSTTSLGEVQATHDTVIIVDPDKDK